MVDKETYFVSMADRESKNFQWRIRHDDLFQWRIRNFLNIIPENPNPLSTLLLPYYMQPKHYQLSKGSTSVRHVNLLYSFKCAVLSQVLMVSVNLNCNVSSPMQLRCYLRPRALTSTRVLLSSTLFYRWNLLQAFTATLGNRSSHVC